MKEMLQKELLTVPEIAEILRVDKSFVYRLLKDAREGKPGSIPGQRLLRGRRSVWRFSTEKFLEWLHQ